MTWQTWIFSEVLFRVGDPLSFALALVSLVPILILLTLLAFVAVPTHLSRDAARLLLILLANEAACQVLKRAFRQGRPVPDWDADLIASRQAQLGFGMPSSHTQLVFCAAAAVTLLHKSSPRRLRLFRTALWGLALAVALSRVYNGYHSFAQVLVGAALGPLVAMAMVRVRLLKDAADALCGTLQTLVTA